MFFIPHICLSSIFFGFHQKKEPARSAGELSDRQSLGPPSGAAVGQVIEERGAAAGVIVDPADHLALLGEVGEVPSDGDGGEPGLGGQGFTGAALLRGLGQMGPDPLQETA